jgi:hypothetical protein
VQANPETEVPHEPAPLENKKNRPMSAAVTGPLNDGVPIHQLEVMSTYNKKKGRRVRREDDVLSEEEKRAEVRDDPVERALPVFNGPDRENDENDENDEDIARRLQEEENAAAA